MIGLAHWKIRFFSLKAKFTIIAVSVGLVCFGITAFLSHQYSRMRFEMRYQEKALLIWTHIIHDLESAMISRSHASLLRLPRIYRPFAVEEIRFFNPDGREALGSTAASPDPQVMETLKTGKQAHYYKTINDHEAAAYVIPIRNKPECFDCHGEAKDLRGALLLSLSLRDMKRSFAQQSLLYLALLGLIGLAISSSTLLTVNRLLLRPLDLLKRRTEALEKGDFEYRVGGSSRDEMGVLNDNFDRMARTMQSSFKVIEERNRELKEQYSLVSRSQKEWQETFDSITDSIAVIDRDFHIYKANRAFREFFSLPPDGPVEEKCFELLGSCLPARCPCDTEHQGRNPFTEEIHDARRGRMLQVTHFPSFSPDGDFSGFICIAKDITEAKEKEMQLIMTERLAALGEMASGIAHEIGNPLATIGACAEGLLRRVGKEKIDLPLFQSYLQVIQEEIARCKQITTSMLSFVRKAPPEKQDLNVHEVLDRTLDMISFHRKSHNVEILKLYQEYLHPVSWNEGELRQVLLAIIVNALDAMDAKQERGTLTLETGSGDGKVFIRISDTGSGIPPEISDKIFDPFFSTKSERGGTGLGLTIARRILEENKGKIDLTSEPGKRSAFTITLPF